jgi:hypothetical protein
LSFRKSDNTKCQFHPGCALLQRARRQADPAQKRAARHSIKSITTTTAHSMRNPTPYLKMRVLGAIDSAEGDSIRARIKTVSQMPFTDEDGHPRQFTWRTIQTWYSRYQKHGLTVLDNTSRSDKGKTRKVTPEALAEAILAASTRLHGKTPTRAALYRVCIEQGLFTRSDVAPNTFSRLAKQYDLLKAESDCENKRRLAFAKAHANELWQADTLCGPYVTHNGAPTQSRLIAFIDDASRVCCHGQFFAAEPKRAASR